MSTGDVRHAVRLGERAALVAAWAIGPLLAATSLWLALTAGIAGQDAHAYWLTAHTDELYRAAPRQVDAFLYSPVFAQAVKPLAMLPWPAFFTAWALLEASILVWLLAPLPARWAVPLFLACVPELVVGNVYVLLAAMVVLGVRAPTVWAFGALTKITPGVGLLWFAARGEWRRFTLGLAAVGALAGASYLIDPAAWRGWLAFLLAHSGDSGDGQIGLAVRSATALGCVVAAARLRRPWLIAVAVVAASPVVGSFVNLVPLVAIPRLLVETQADIPAESTHPVPLNQTGLPSVESNTCAPAAIPVGRFAVVTTWS